jgi:Holliday junction DNA helicase RuvA
MIAYLKGTLLSKQAASVIVLCHGVGYECFISAETYARIPPEGSETELYVHTQVREDDISLFGFSDKAEKEIFIKLISISGIGAKMALAVQSTFSAGELIDIAGNGQVERLTQVPGVGRKTAERLLLELHDKLKKIGLKASSMEGKDSRIPASGQEALLALETLGYPTRQAEQVIASIQRENPAFKTADLVRAALKAMR